MFETPEFGVLTIIQARHGSSRLPGKALMKLAGKPMLAHVIERAVAIGWPVMVATSTEKQDDKIAKLATKCGVKVHRGDQKDVLGRMSDAARHARIVIRITGDCPLIAPDVAQAVFQHYVQGGDVIATNDTSCSGWPDGMDVEVFTAESLHQAADQATEDRDREHVTRWIRRHRQHVILDGPKDGPKVKLSVDTQTDFDRVARVFAKLNGDLGYQATFKAVEEAMHGDLDLSPRAMRAFKERGLTPQGASKMSDEELLGMRGVGQATIDRLREVF